MQSAGEQVMDNQILDVPMEGGKRRRSNKNNKKGGAIEVGSVLGPAILYGLRRSFKSKKQRGGDAFSSQASPVGESTGPLLAVVPVVAPAGSAVVPPSVDMVPKEAVAVPTDSGDASLAGGAKKGKKGKKGPMAEGRFGVKGKLGPLSASTGIYGKVKAWGGDNDDKKDDDNNNQDGGKKKQRRSKKGGDKQDDKKDDKNDNNNQDGGKKKQRKAKKGGDKQDDKKDDKNDNNNQDGGKKKQRRTKKVKGGALDLYAQQLEQISSSLNELLFN